MPTTRLSRAEVASMNGASLANLGSVVRSSHVVLVKNWEDESVVLNLNEAAAYFVKGAPSRAYRELASMLLDRVEQRVPYDIASFLHDADIVCRGEPIEPETFTFDLSKGSVPHAARREALKNVLSALREYASTLGRVALEGEFTCP